MRDEALVHEVVLVDPPVALARVEYVHRLARREPPQLGHADLDHEAAARLEVGRDVAEAGHLLGLRGQVVDRVEDEVSERERAVDPRCGKVADRHRDRLAAELLAQPRDHRLRKVDPVHLHPAPGERERDAAGPDPELQRPAVACERSEEIDRRFDGLAREHLGGRLVVPRGDALVEVPVAGHGATIVTAARPPALGDEFAGARLSIASSASERSTRWKRSLRTD